MKKNRRMIFGAALLLVLGIASIVAPYLVGHKTARPFKLTSAEMRFCQLSFCAGAACILGSCVLFVLTALGKTSKNTDGNSENSGDIH